MKDGAHTPQTRGMENIETPTPKVTPTAPTYATLCARLGERQHLINHLTAEVAVLSAQINQLYPVQESQAPAPEAPQGAA